MKRRFVACLAVALLGGLSARALSLLLVPETTTVSESELVVLGSVQTATAQWLDPDGDGVESIYTVATFKVEQCAKGGVAPGTILTLHVFGGTIGNQTMVAAGIPTFKQDERLILCLMPRRDTAKYTSVTGAVLGRWVVHTDADGKDWAVRELGDVTLYQRNEKGDLVETTVPREPEEPLADVMARLQAEASK